MVVCNLEAVENCLAMAVRLVHVRAVQTPYQVKIYQCFIAVDNFPPAMHTIPTDPINAFCTFHIIHTVHGRACECEHRSPQVA